MATAAKRSMDTLTPAVQDEFDHIPMQMPDGVFFTISDDFAQDRQK